MPLSPVGAYRVIGRPQGVGLMDFMIRGLELESRLDSKTTPKFEPKLDTS